MTPERSDQETYDILLEREEENRSFIFHGVVFVLIASFLTTIRAMLSRTWRPADAESAPPPRQGGSSSLLTMLMVGWGLGIIIRHFDLLGILDRKADPDAES